MCEISDNRKVIDSYDKVSFDVALSLTGYGKFNIFIFLAAGGALMAVIMETMGMMFIVPAATCDLNLDLASKGFLSSSSYFGVFASSFLWGFIADTKGRRNVILITSYVSFLMTFLSSLVGQVWLFILLRFLNGFFVGGASAVVYAYAGEFHSDTYRPKIISWMAVFIALGNMLLPGLAWLTLPATWSFPIDPLGIVFRPWRLLIILYGFPSVVFATMLLFLPESPKYLLSQGLNDEGLEVMKKMYQSNTGRSRKEFPVKFLIWDEPSRDHSLGILRTVWEQIAPLFRREYIWKTVMVCTLQFGIFFSTNGFMMWYPEILNQMTLLIQEDPEGSVSMCSAFFDTFSTENMTVIAENVQQCTDSLSPNVFISNLIMYSIYCVLYVTVGGLINVVGQKNMFYVLFAVCGCSGLVAQHVYGDIWFQICVMIFLSTTSCISITNTVVVDLYPTQFRAMALAVSLMMGRLGAVVGAQVMGWMLHALCELSFFVFALDNIVLLVIVFLLPSPKTPKLIDPIV